MSARCRGCGDSRWTTRSSTPGWRRFSRATPPIPAPGPAPSRARRRIDRPRAAIVAMLEAQQARRDSPPAARAAVAALADPSTVAIVTGQQAGLFGGPLFTLLKAVTAIRLSARLSREHGVTAVPVFWIDAEDHDWDEIAGCGVLAADQTLRRVRGRRARGRRRAHRRVAALHRRHRRRARGTGGDAAGHRVHRRACSTPFARPISRGAGSPRRLAGSSTACSARTAWWSTTRRTRRPSRLRRRSSRRELEHAGADDAPGGRGRRRPGGPRLPHAGVAARVVGGAVRPAGRPPRHPRRPATGSSSATNR